MAQLEINDFDFVAERVGWVERSDTHPLHFVEVMGFAGLNPSYGLTANNAA